MEPLLTFVAGAVFPDLLTSAAVHGAAAVQAANPDWHVPDGKRVGEAVAKLTGNNAPWLLRKIEHLLAWQLQQHRDAVLQQHLKVRLDEYFNGIENALADAEFKYNRFLSDKCPATWQSFCQAVDLEKEIRGLFRKIETNSRSRADILREFDAVSGRDLREYQTWQQTVCLIFLRAYHLRTAFRYFDTFPDKSYVDNEQTRDPDRLWSTVLSMSVEQELLTMENETKTIVKRMQDNYRVVQTYFLTLTCGDPLHKRHCGAGSDEQCSQLGARVYRFLRDGDGTPNHDLAEAIAQDLQTEYKHLHWSAVVFSGHTRHEYLVNQNHRSVVCLQRSGSESHNALKRVARDRVIVSAGHGEYGCFVSYRIRTLSSKTAIVFWADPNTNRPEAMEAVDRLHSKWSALTHETKQSMGNVHSLTHWMGQQNEDYVFAVDVRAPSEKDPIGLYLTERDVHTFPLCLTGGASSQSCVLLWPATVSSGLTEQTLECKVDNGLYLMIM